MRSDDREIARRIRKGDSAAFDLLFDRYAPPLLGYLTGMVGERCRAEDLLQETMIRVFRKIDCYREQGVFRAWIFRIATNLALTDLRRSRLEPVAVDGAILENRPDERPDPQTKLEMIETSNRVEEGIQRLPEDHRAVILMRVRHEMSIREIARTLSLKEGTVKSRIHYAVGKLRQYMNTDEWTPGKGGGLWKNAEE